MFGKSGYRLVRIEGAEALNEIAHMRFDAYDDAGLLDGSCADVLVDKYDHLEHSYIIGVTVDDIIVGTIRLQTVDKHQSVSVSMDVFGDLLQDKIDQGLRIADVGRMCTHKHCRLSLGKLLVQIYFAYAKYIRADISVGSSIKRHVPFYKHFGKVDVVSDARMHPTLVEPRYLMMLDHRKVGYKADLPEFDFESLIPEAAPHPAWT